QAGGLKRRHGFSGGSRTSGARDAIAGSRLGFGCIAFMAGFALSVGEAGVAEFIATGFTGLRAAVAQTNVTLLAVLTAARAESFFAAFTDRQTVKAGFRTTSRAARYVVLRRMAATFTTTHAGPVFELDVRTSRVVGVQDPVHDLEE